MAEDGVERGVNGANLAAVEELSSAEPFDGALVDLYRKHAKELVEMLWVFLGDRAAAEDIVQESFIRLHRAWPRLDHSRPLGGYLRTTAFNLARSGLRRRMVALRHRPAPMHDVASAEAGVVLREDQREVAAALRRLPARQRECIVLRYWADQTEAEIAATLGVSVNSVKTHLRRGMEALERRLGVAR
jgi:RNA polymerase sigma-70 factor (sigma-E family)